MAHFTFLTERLVAKEGTRRGKGKGREGRGRGKEWRRKGRELG